MMVKTQVQIPDHLYAEGKRIAREYEMSFAEVVCQGLETLAPSYPPRKTSTEKWSAPVARAPVGWKGLSAEELKN